jgi:iron-sulfur cluster repair protein YtfE (RIC family)
VTAGPDATARTEGRRSIDSAETVEDAARRSPHAAEILRGFGIDTCCGGRLTLSQAAASAGIAVETVLEALGPGRGDAT